MSAIQSQFARVLGAHLKPEQPLESAQSFRHAWFSSNEEGQAFYFLFTKNLSVTNVQYAELLSLLRLHTYDRSTNLRAGALHFVTGNEFDTLLADISEPFAGEGSHERIAKSIATLYGDLFARTVIIDPYFGSCNVFIPPTLAVDLIAICSESGYVHSCGYSVFVRNMTKAEPSLLSHKLEEHLKLHPPLPNKRLRFLVYANEDFTDYDRDQESILSGGLDDSKINVEKAWFRSRRVVDLLDDLAENMSNRIIVGEPGDYRDSLANQQQMQDIDRTRTLWLVQDRDIGEPCERPGADRFYICYDQLFLNRNAVYIFDENKPAWRAHTTLPPTLAGALINLVRRPERDNAAVWVADPFIGTGTSLFEAMRFPTLRFEGSDIDEVSKQLIADNLEFFSMDAAALRKITGRLREVRGRLVRSLRSEAKPTPTPQERDRALSETDVFVIASRVLQGSELAEQARNVELPQIVLADLGGSLFERLIAYIALRTSQRYSARFVRQQTEGNLLWFGAYIKETDTLVRHFEELASLREKTPLKSESWDKLCENYRIVAGSDRAILIRDHYSPACTPGYQLFEGLSSKIVSVPLDDQSNADVALLERSADTLTEDRYHIIIGDPPYGFNTLEETESLAGLYRSFIEAALMSLRDGGDLILCLPERSHSGRYSPAFTHRELVVHELHLSAGKVGRQLVFPRDGVRGREDLFSCDYYWESPKALRRSVIHVQVRHLPMKTIEVQGSEDA